MALKMPTVDSLHERGEVPGDGRGSYELRAGQDLPEAHEVPLPEGAPRPVREGHGQDAGALVDGEHRGAADARRSPTR